jgi:hypothetical protein
VEKLVVVELRVCVWVGVGGGMTSRQLCEVPYYGNSRPPEPKIRVQRRDTALDVQYSIPPPQCGSLARPGKTGQRQHQTPNWYITVDMDWAL